VYISFLLSFLPDWRINVFIYSHLLESQNGTNKMHALLHMMTVFMNFSRQSFKQMMNMIDRNTVTTGRFRLRS